MEHEKPAASVHVNFRINAGYMTDLEEEATKRDMSLNAFVNHVFARFLSFDRATEESQRVVLRKEFLVHVVSLISAEEFDELARNLSVTVLKPDLVFSGSATSMNDLVKNYFLPMGMYSGWFRARVIKTPMGHKLILQHEYGPKWTIFLKEYYSVAIRSLIDDGVKIVAEDGVLEIHYR
jgi:hypothetical protein